MVGRFQIDNKKNLEHSTQQNADMDEGQKIGDSPVSVSSASSPPQKYYLPQIIIENKDALLNLRFGEKTKLYKATILDWLLKEQEKKGIIWLSKIIASLSDDLKLERHNIIPLCDVLETEEQIITTSQDFKKMMGKKGKHYHRLVKKVSINQDEESQQRILDILAEAQEIMRRITNG